MRIEHAALWTHDLEGMKSFYEQHFGAKAGSKYSNPRTHFESYFLCFESGARLELMSRPTLLPHPDPAAAVGGYAHLAFALGDRARVVELTERLRAAGFPVLDGPRVTGDGYFESVVLDPDGNRIELTT